MRIYHVFYIQDIQPNIDDMQIVLTKATQLVLEVSRSVIQWGEDRELVTRSKPTGRCEPVFCGPFN